jgi:hypothetical protein
VEVEVEVEVEEEGVALWPAIGGCRIAGRE